MLQTGELAEPSLLRDCFVLYLFEKLSNAIVISLLLAITALAPFWLSELTLYFVAVKGKAVANLIAAFKRARNLSKVARFVNVVLYLV